MENIFQHYAAGERLYTMTVAPVCEKYGLTYMEFTVLMFLANNPQFDTAAEIVKYRHLTKSHVSMSVRSLQERGLIKGEYREPNRRTIHLSVLEAAAPIVLDGREAQRAFGDVLFSGFSKQESARFTEFMDRIDKNIAEHMKVRQK